jgi:hypothetical protein
LAWSVAKHIPSAAAEVRVSAKFCTQVEPANVPVQHFLCVAMPAWAISTEGTWGEEIKDLCGHRVSGARLENSRFKPIVSLVWVAPEGSSYRHMA